MYGRVEPTTGGGAAWGAGTAWGSVGAATQLSHETRHADTDLRTAWLCQHQTWRPHRLPRQFFAVL